MKKALALLLSLLCLCPLFTGCAKEDKTENPSLGVLLEMEEEQTVSSGAVTFTLQNTTDCDCFIRGPLGSSMMLFQIDGETDKTMYAFFANSPEYYEDSTAKEGCTEENGIEYFTLPAGQTVIYSLPLRWFNLSKLGNCRLQLLLSFDLETFFPYTLEQDFTLY